MKLIIGLGNPGGDYQRTRHNIGFMVLDEFARLHGASFLPKSKFKAELAETTINGEKVLLAKPTTFYNSSGEAVRAIMDFYKITPADVLVIHDELALPFGTLRARSAGSDAGNNGIKNISGHVGENYARLRVGTWNERRDQLDDAVFVLSPLSRDERNKLQENIIPAVIIKILGFIRDQFTPHTHTP